MLRKKFFFLVFIFPGSFFAQEDVSHLLHKADSLIARKKYYTAYRLLAEADPDNQNPAIQLKKEDIVLDGFLISIQHQLFGLKDLEPDESIEQLRGKSGIYNLVPFSVDSVLMRLAERFPHNAEIFKGLGRYYWDYYLRYGGMLDDPEPFYRKALENFRQALLLRPDDVALYNELGEIYVEKGEMEQARKMFARATKLRPDDSTAHYNLGYVLAVEGQYERALDQALQAARFYYAPALKADAYGLAGIALNQLGRYREAIPYFQKAWVLNPYNYDVVYGLTQAYLKSGDSRHMETARRLLELDPADSRFYDMLWTLYDSEGRLDTFKSLLQSHLKRFPANDTVGGHVYLYLARVALKQSDKTRLREWAEKAREYYSRFLSEDHPVFGLIRKLVQEAGR